MDVILLMAMTLDGKIARDSAQPVDWSGQEDKDYFVKITKEAGVMVMGSKTFDTIGKPLPLRKNIVMTRNKERQSQDDNLIFTDQSPKKILQKLSDEGYGKVTLIGGAVINSLFAKENLITEIHVTIVPILFGEGLSLFDKTMESRLELMENIVINRNHLLLKYRVLK